MTKHKGEEMMNEYTLPKGTVCKINGIPFALNEDTVIRCHEENWKLMHDDQRSCFSQSDCFCPNPTQVPGADALTTNNSSSLSI